jgi:alpha-tubulin suppressor-like RCC1 family protein
VRIEYRPKPVAAGLSFAMLEDESQVGFRTVTIGPSSGYSHAYGLKATKIQILKDSTLQRVSIGNGTCSGTSCEIPCTSDGQCSVELQPDPNYYGPGQFSFHITVLDDAFSPARELKTNTPGIVSIDIRPQPEAHNLAWNSKAGDPVAIVLANAANTGYQHPVHDYAASKVSIVTAPTAGTLSANITCETTPGATNYRQCLGTYSPTGATYGTDSLTYKLAVYDQVLGRDIWSDHKTLTFRVRPLPIATGFATAWTTKENTPRDLVLQLGAVETDKLGYWYPNNQAPDYDVHPYAILITQNPNVTKGSLSASGFACTSGTTSPKGCQTTFTPAVNQYGSTSFKYKVQIQDQYVGLVTSNEQPINIDVRPIIRASDISYTTNTSFRTIQDQDLVWQISNGATTGYTYPTDATYNTVRDTLAIATYDRPSDGGGTILPGASCVGASGICSGTFRPTPGFFNTGTSNAAKFDFEVSVLDASLPLPMQTITSLRKTVSIDVYPKPVANNITRYTVEGQAISVAIKRGTGLGFTHARNHNPIGITVSGSNAIATLDGSHFTCTTDTCTATVTPVGYSASALAADAASFNYYVDVRETGTNPRTARSDNTGKATITVYPRSVPSFAVATQIIAFEGEAASISLKKGVDIGYTHPWNDSAVGVTVENKSTGSVVSTFTCTSGECSATFTPPLGTSASSYGDSKGWIDYKTKTTYGNLSPADVLSSTTARANFKIRAVPRVDTTWTKSGFIENTDFNFDIVRGSGYQYLDDTAYTDATIKIAYRNPSRVACKAPISCVATNEYTCDQNGNKTCRVGLTPEANWNRVDGMASLEYKIGVVDSVAGVTKWSPWSKANFPLIPRPYNPTPSGENKLIFSDGIQGSPYNFSVSLSNGYTHEEGLFAKRMWLYSAGKTNLSSPITDSSATCNATGLCSLSIAPITTAFGAVSARDQNGTTNGSWGWSALQYSVEHEIDGVVVTPPSSQPKGNAFVYFRPIPEKDDLNFVNAIENEEFTIQVKNKSGSCTSNCGYVFPDEFSLAGVTQHYADTIAVTAPTGGATLTQASSCNSATGVCTVKVKRTDAGPVTFTTKVTVNGVTQSVASPVSVYFQARARTSNLTASTTEGTPAVIEIKRGAGYTQLDNLNAGSVLITNITNAEGGKIYWMDAVDGTPTECSTSGSAKLCSCVGDKCIIRFVPRAWSSGEGVLTGSFKFQTRDASLKEADGVTPLSALNVSTVTINMNPRIVTNSRSYPAGVNEGEEGVVKTVEIKEGAGGTNIGGFDHVFDHRIDFIKVTTVTGATVSGLNSWVACSGGVCNVPLTPLADAAFVTNGSFTYHLKDLNGYESHVAGTASVYFYPRPKASSRSIVVAKNSSSNVLSIASGAGYSHALNTPASTWGRPTSPTETPAGTLSGWTCDAAGNCTVNFTPNPDAYTDSATPTKFDYRVGVTAPHGTVYSDAPHGLFSIDIFPRPVATAATKELRWVEGIGDITKPAGQQMRITIQKNVDYTHDRGSNPVKIIATNVTGGTLSPFICGSSACWADFTPTATSPDPTTAAASFKLQTVVEDAVKYLAYPTDPVTYSIVIMPKPLAKAFTVQTIQGETHDFNMGSVANTTSTPKTFDSLDAPWGMGYTAPANIEITEQPSQSGSPTGTLSLSTCTSGNCSVRFVPINQLIAGNSTFKYRVRMTHPSDPTKFDAYSAEETGTINQAYAYTVTGRLFEKQQILGADGVIPVTEIPLAIELNNGYSKLTGYPLIQDLQITSTLSSAQGTIVDATMNNGVWSAKFRSAPFWFGEVSLNYRVCKTGCTLTDDVKSLSSTSPATAMRIKVIPNNNPPTACNKSLIVFQNQAKRVSMERDNTSCGNGKWYGDLDNDDVNKVRFLGVSDTTSWGTFAGISVANGGDGTTCSTSGSDVICSCATAACTWQWTPPSGAVNVDKIINWSIETYSSVIKANFASQTNGQITFSIKSPLQPVAENLTFTSVEDTNLTVSLGPSEGYLTPTEINAAYAPLPDGYPMVPSDVIIDSHTATFRTVDATGCDISTGICTIIVSPQWDVVGTGTITYRIKANGLWSAQKTITVTYTSVDDAPNTYGSDERDLVLYRRLWFDTNPYLQDTRSMGTFYVGGVGSPVTVTLKPYLNASVGDNPMRAGFPNSGTWDWWGYGYYDVDGDKAIKVRIDPATLVGGTISYAAGKSASDAMTCDANGACSFVMVPDGTRVENWMTVNYYVTTKRGTVEKEQPVASSLAIWVSQGDDTPFTNYHLPVQNQENPDINMANYDENYIIGRAMSKNFVLRNGTDALAAWQSNSWRGRPWYNSAFPNTELATNIEVGNGANGAPAPSGGSVDGISCNGGTCTGSFSSLTSYDTYPTTASFWYRVVSGQNYSYGYYNFGNNIVAKSPWKKVTFKVALNAPGSSCLLAGEIETDALVKTDALQGTSFTARISNGANASANQNYAYSHPGEGAEWRPLARLEVLDANGSTVSHTCANGICDINWGLPGSTTPSNFNDDLLGHASIRIRGYDDINCVTNTTWIHARIMPKLKARHVSSRRYYGDPTVKINGQTKKVENYHAFKGDYVYEPLNQTGPTTISFRKRGALSVHEGAYDYDTSAANNVNATKVRIYGFNDEAALRLRSPLSAAISGTGVSCTGTTVADFACETTNCNSDGTCSFNFYANQNQEWGFVTFKWKAYLGDGTESRTYHWHPINTNPEDYLPNDWENHIPGETERHLYIRAVPIVTNPTFSTSPNEPLTLTLGRESLSYKGYNYPDAATFGANSGANGIQINVSNFRNGAATETVFDQTNYALTLKASPNYNFVGQMMFDYVVTVWGIASATGTAAVNVGSHLTANAVTFNTQSNTPLSGSIQKGIDFVKNAGFIEENPLDLQVVNEDLSLVPSAKGTVAIGTCTASGCPFTYTPPTAYTGTVNLKYRLKGGTLASPTWSNYAPLTIDVLPAPAKPVVYNLSLVGADETAKLIAISPGITSGYTDANGDKATKLHITSVTNGQITPSSPIDCDSSGLCLVSFTPDVGFYGNGSFSFNVEAGGEQALSPATVTVDFKPQLRVQNLTVNGSLNQPKAITIGRGTGYTYSPGAAVDTLLITGVTNGTISGSLTEIPCSSGSCALTFTPNTGFTGNASIQFRARISGTTNVESNIATITIAVAATDSAPVATDYTLNLASRNASLLQFELGKEYTDLEGDKASTLTLNSVLGGTTDTSSCNGTTGICSVNFTPNSNYFGQGRILYTVTANGKISNLGTITLVIPDDTARSYTLGWSAAPTLSDQCLVTIPSQITVRNGAQSCGTGNCVTPTIGTLSSAITSLAVTADLDSVDGQINLFSSLGRHLTSWEVSNGTETAKIGRFLELKSLGQPARARRPILTTVPAYDTAMEGVQSPYEGCIGSSCGSSKWSSVASGDGFSCALHADGRVFCWGSNAEGKLGRHESPGSTASSWDAKAIRDPLDPLSDLYGLTAVTAGKHHACALTASKRVVCWGSNEFGQLGANLPTGSGKAEDTPVYVRNTTNTANLGSIAAISAGDNHTCAVDTNRMVYCWGQNNHGQVGDGTRELTAIPKSVKIVTAKSASDEVLTTGDLTNIFSVSTGAAHSCAIRLTLSGSSVTAQNILCWGANDQNQIGDNDYYNNDASLLTRVSADASPVDRLYPVLVRNSANEALANPISVHTGGRTSCAVLASGVAQCWGSNTSGIAGVNDPSVNASVKNPTTIKSSNGIGDLTDIVTVAVGSNHACALLGTRKLVCWGENGTGQVGSGTQSSSHLPTTVRQAAATDLNPVFAVSLGANHSCLAASDGIRCFGANDSKQIGRENAAPSVSYAEDPVYLSDGAFDAARRSCSHRYDIIVP